MQILSALGRRQIPRHAFFRQGHQVLNRQDIDPDGPVSACRCQEPAVRAECEIPAVIAAT
jgi:hypothetical protein